MRAGLILMLVSVATAPLVGFAGTAEASGVRAHTGVMHHAKGAHHPRMVHDRGAHRGATIAPFGPALLSGGAPVTVINEARPAATTQTVNLNTHQTVVGIRRAPEAAPLLFIIPSDRREARQAARASAAIRSLGSADTTVARIIVVR